jgi:hypothetical protein
MAPKQHGHQGLPVALRQGDQLEFALTIVVTVVGGKSLVRRCLEAICRQAEFADTEIIVPYDNWSKDTGELADEFPQVNFHFISDLGPASSAAISSHKHRLYDRRRAVGISLARGRIIALIEDYAVPAPDWCSQILLAHEQPHAVIGGAINNAVDRPLNWALYYSDFGRYGSPLALGEAEYASDVNIAYKHEALQAVRCVWHNAYHETLVNWTLQARGESVFLDPRPIVFEERPPISFGGAFSERIAWGRVFAESRVAVCSRGRRLTYAAGTTILPLLLLYRVLKHMLRQRRSLAQIITTLPLAALLLTGWSLGELAGYISGPIAEDYSLTEIVPET